GSAGRLASTGPAPVSGLVDTGEPLMTLNRRAMLLGGTAVLATAAAPMLFRSGTTSRAAEGTFEVEKTEAEWRALLSDLEYQVLREEGTERPYSSPLNDEKRAGIYNCRGCDLPLFDAATKYDSRTGWPSFYQPLDNAVGEAIDYKIGL